MRAERSLRSPKREESGMDYGNKSVLGPWLQSRHILMVMSQDLHRNQMFHARKREGKDDSRSLSFEELELGWCRIGFAERARLMDL
jgi:hypothetical protein